MNKKISYLIIALVVVVAGVFLILSFSQKKPQTQTLQKPAASAPAIQKAPTTQFSTQAFKGFPEALAPTGGLSPQYWDNAQFTGALFYVKESLKQALSDYQTQLASAGWEISGLTTSDSSAAFNASDKQTGGNIQVSLNSLPNNDTSISIGVQK